MQTKIIASCTERSKFFDDKNSGKNYYRQKKTENHTASEESPGEPSESVVTLLELVDVVQPVFQEVAQSIMKLF